ncbi:unnamed protein product [Durusdinium trenchii]|uniref:Uncharacterized protein n=1 Tax=Durusdinium trenchii TaxID=1381693 RepID=A0ABP0P979_9DINO
MARLPFLQTAPEQRVQLTSYPELHFPQQHIFTSTHLYISHLDIRAYPDMPIFTPCTSSKLASPKTGNGCLILTLKRNCESNNPCPRSCRMTCSHRNAPSPMDRQVEGSADQTLVTTRLEACDGFSCLSPQFDCSELRGL